jgi:septum formation protein
MTVILASGSPRRRELLRNICEDFTVLVPTVDEAAVAAPFSRSPRRMVMALSRAMALAVRQTESADAIIGADTVVALGRTILGKPENTEQAYAMLRALSGRTHKVWTGVSVRFAKRTVTYAVCTRIRFYRLTDEQIQAYVDSKEGMDKAGGYGIQGRAGEFVKEIRKDYFNVVGLPLKRLARLLG